MRRSIEHSHQVALFRWAALMRKQIPELDLLIAIPNGGHRHIAVARKLKAEGVKAGIPDIALFVPRTGDCPETGYPCVDPCGTFHGLFIELKAPGGKVSPAQTGWITALRKQGYRVEICRSWVEAKDLILEYLGVKI